MDKIENGMLRIFSEVGFKIENSEICDFLGQHGAIVEKDRVYFSEDWIPNFLNYLHSYLQSRYIGNITAEPDSNISLVRGKAQKVIDEFEIKTKNELVDKLLNEYNPNRLGVLGIDATIKALLIEQIRILIYDRQFTHEGYICDLCYYLTVEYKDKCPYCDGKMVFYNDIVDEIVEDALNQGCEIVDIEGNEKLIRAGSIGAMLRYKL